MKSSRSFFYYYSGSLLSTILFLLFVLYALFSAGIIGDEGTVKLLENPVTIIVALALIIIVPLVFTFYSRKKGDFVSQEEVNFSLLCYFVAFFMVFYGFAKIGGKFFDVTYLTLDSRVADTDSFFLTWYYFGKSNTQEFVIGLMEFIPALLLMFRRTAFIAAVLMLPVALNVVWINVFNHISGLTFFVSIFIGLANIHILFYYKEQIKELLLRVKTGASTGAGGILAAIVRKLRLAIMIFMAFIIGTGIFSHIFPHPDRRYNNTNKFRGAFELQSLVVDGKPLQPEAGNNQYYKKIYLEPQSRWNTVLTYDSVFKPKAITVIWRAKSDSVDTYMKLSNDVTNSKVDASTSFKGTYILKGEKLFIKGVQYGKAIEAVYKKLPLKDYKWFW